MALEYFVGTVYELNNDLLHILFAVLCDLHLSVEFLWAKAEQISLNLEGLLDELILRHLKYVIDA